MRAILGVLCSTLFIVGCSTITSVGDWDTPEEFKDASGYYHLPRTILNVKVDGTPSITVTSSTESDPYSAVLYKVTHNPLFDDTIDVQIANGLLTSVGSTSVDESANIATDIAKLVFTTATNGATLSSRALQTSGALTGFSASYDPFDQKQALSVRRALYDLGYCILVGDEVKIGVRACGAPPKWDPRAFINASYANANPGIYYRRQTPVPITVFAKSSNGVLSPIFIGNELFFDKAKIYRVDVDRSAFVTKSVNLTFTSGVLSEVKVNNPSEVKGVADGVVQVAEIIFSIPLAGLQQNKSLVDAQAALLTSQSNLIQTQQSLVALEATQSTDGRTLSFTPNYSLTGRSVTIPTPNLGMTDVDSCVRMWGWTRDQCTAAINKDATH